MPYDSLLVLKINAMEFFLLLKSPYICYNTHGINVLGRDIYSE